MLFSELSIESQDAIVMALLGKKTELTESMRLEITAWRDDDRNFTRDSSFDFPKTVSLGERADANACFN